MPRGDSSNSELSLSESSSPVDTESDTTENIMLEDPMYHILGHYLQSDKGNNIANVLEMLVKEVRELRMAISSLRNSSSLVAPPNTP